MSLEEIAGTLDLALGTVKSSLHRAVHRLRDRLSALAGVAEGT
jgi:DNA-directed RNA polymerase specialized sigma24 family protein